VVYAVITDAGLVKLAEARSTHVPQIEEHFARRLGSDELARLVGLLGQLGDEGTDVPCDAGD
jgi:hypothetical protein